MKFHPLLLAPAVALFALATPLPAAAPGPDGATLFKQRCASCHSVEAGKVSPIGPNLAGIVGRAAGSTKFNYSPALKGSGITWTRAKLDTFLAAPMKTVPGTRMVMAVPNAADRAAVLNYLASAR